MGGKVLRVLMISERWFPSVGGGEFHILHLVRGLVSEGIEVDLVSRDLQGGVRPEGCDGMDGFRVVRLPPRSSFENPLGRSLYAPLLVNGIKELGPHDLIHVHCPLGSFPAAYLRRKLRIPLVRTLHGVYAGKWSAMLGYGPRALLFTALEALSLSLAYDAVIAVDKKSLESGLGVGHSVARWIPNGVDWSRFDAVEIGSPEVFTFLFVGRLVPQKGLVYLLEASSILEDSGEEFQLLLVGEGPDRGKLERRARAMELHNLHFLGLVNDERLTGLYASSHAFVLPSLWEGLPLTLLEAWAARLPVVTTGVGGVQQVAQDGRNALLVEAGSAQALAQRMRELMKDDSLRRRLASSGRRLVEERFSWDRVTEETIEVYRGCIS